MSSNEKKYSTCSSICNGIYHEGFSLDIGNLEEGAYRILFFKHFLFLNTCKE